MKRNRLSTVFALLFIATLSISQIAAGEFEDTSGWFQCVTDETTGLEKCTISSPPASQIDFERQAVDLPEPNIAAGVNILTVPTFDWYMGCSATSASMIAAYYDRDGLANMYTGPTNGGVMPMDNSSWGTFTDIEPETYRVCPLTGSRNGWDGRVTRGSSDDYWIQYGSTAADPFITNGWAEHAWGEAIGDYMKTSQSTYDNSDGSTGFWSYSSSTPLTCQELFDYGPYYYESDGTYGVKLFYEARGYTVTDCYIQATDNQYTGGFSFAQYMAEIDAGHPVMFHVQGHTMVGVGYDTAGNTMYINDTWDWSTHTMTWGGSYYGMTMWGVSILHLADVVTPPGAFAKSAPSNGATVTTSPSLAWGASSGADGYEYCYDTNNNGACDASWVSTGTSTGTSLVGLSNSTTYYWQVRATNAGGTTYADSGTWWSFTTVPSAPGAFAKSAPSNGATVSTSPSLSWGASSGAAGYEYCYDTSNNSACDASWISTGTSTGASLGGLSNSTAYYWQVRATNAGGTTYADSGTWWSFTTLPPAPGGFAKEAPANEATVTTSPTLSWGASSGAAGYEYCYDAINNSMCDTSWISTGTSTEASLSGLPNSALYFWQVRAVNAGGSTEANGGLWWHFTTLPDVPFPFNKTAPADETNVTTSPTLTWSESYFAYDYEYCYDQIDNGACDESWLSTGGAGSVDLDGLSNSTSYFWQVRAVNPSGTTYADGGTWWSFTTLPPAPGAFAKETPANGATVTTGPNLSWEASSGADGYEYCYDTSNNGACDASWVSTGTSTGSSLVGLSNSTMYYWQVRAVNTGGTTYADGGTWWSFTTLPSGPGAFAKAAPADAANVTLSPTLSWNASSGADDYEYCYDQTDDGACDGSWTSSAGATNAALSGLTNVRTYYWQVRAVNAGGTTYANGGTWWSFNTQSQTFADVPISYWAWAYIERLYSAGITGGCASAPLRFCPAISVNRAEMAIFLERGIHGSSYTPPPASGTVFTDVPLSYWAAAWIEQLYADGITGGCGGGKYCPNQVVTRAEMAIFLLRAEHGSAYTPPAATGTVFTDVPISYWAAAWIEQLNAEGITGGCGGGNYCPAQAVTRAEMAVFLVRTFSLP